MDMYGFYTGKILDVYKYLGCHVTKDGVVFRTFAPAADRITIVGEFNGWQETEMNKVYDGNFWECYVKNAKAGEMTNIVFTVKTGIWLNIATLMVLGWNLDREPHLLFGIWKAMYFMIVSG